MKGVNILSIKHTRSANVLYFAIHYSRFSDNVCVAWQ